MNELQLSDDISLDLFNAYQLNHSKHINIEDYNEDLQRFVFITKILRKYKNGTVDINIRLLINHCTILFNCFDPITTIVLHRYVDDDLKPELYSILKFFSRLGVEYKAEPINIDLYDDMELCVNAKN